MFKQASMMFLHAETPLHVGSGESLGAVDLAIQRERYTDFPIAQASGVKGAVREWFECVDPAEEQKKRVRLVFGPEDNASEHAGAAAFTDARILLFPVRSMKGVFAWITCPTVLQRFRRDLAITGKEPGFVIPSPEPGSAVGTAQCAVHVDDKVVLEEFSLSFVERAGEVAPVAAWMKDHALPALPEYDFWRNRLATHVLVLHDDDFRDFVKNSTEVVARVKLGKGKSTDTKKDGNLFYQENLPCDALLYALVMAHGVLGEPTDGLSTAEEVMDFVRRLQGQRLQIGGDETIGRGIVCVNFL